MFIVAGIVSILAGFYGIMQSTLLYILGSMASHDISVLNPYMFIGIALIFAGATALASHEGGKKWFVYSSIFFYIATLVLGIIYFSSTLMAIFAVAAGIMIALYGFWLMFHHE